MDCVLQNLGRLLNERVPYKNLVCESKLSDDKTEGEDSTV